MCGICGFYGFEDKELLKKMNRKLIHRGPDQDGFYFDKNISLGMRRLSIIDLSERGRQPHHNEDETVWVVFNGEIYNFQEIKNTLEKRKHHFYSGTDTEVIVHAYEEWGFDCLKHFNGMFAFALWDKKKKLLFIARDRLGVKPLHYYWDNEKFLFASEIKAILEDKTIKREINTEALAEFIAFEYVPAPHTMFKNIYKLKPGHYLTLKEKTLTITQYWNTNVKENTKYNEQDWIDTTKELLKDAVEKRMISDVPLGAFLSGGIDSSTVVAIMSKLSQKPIKTFSIGFTEESYDESKDARIIAETFHTEHHEKIIEAKEILKILPIVTENLDEPFGDLSIFPTYLVSEFARTKVTVSLSGDGGDELFGGYDWYLAQSLAKSYKKIPFQNLIHPIIHKIPQSKKSKGMINYAKRFIEGIEKEESLAHLRWMSNIKPEAISTLLNKQVQPFKALKEYQKNTNSLNDNMYTDIKTYLPDDIMTKVDRASMMVSLEAREPLLDYRLVEHAMSIPAKYKVKGLTRKYILKKTMKDILPKEILYKQKQGFTIPMKHWMREELKDMLQEKLSKDNLQKTNLFNHEYVNKVLQEHMNKQKDNQRHLWSILSVVLWHEKYIQQK